MEIDHPPRETRPVLPTEDRSSILAGSLWMVAISLALFFLPLINGLIGGVVGGYKVGAVGRALVAAILPAAIVALGLWLVFALWEAPFWGLVAGLTGGLLVLLADVGIFVGAAIGGLLAARRSRAA
jgi:hypothetical protein